MATRKVGPSQPHHFKNKIVATVLARVGPSGITQVAGKA